MPARASVAAFLLIVALAAAVRGFRLDEVPPGFYLDEASIGVEARTLAETGADSTGTRWPLVFRALDDWKHPLYVYGAAASVKALGPTRVAVRLPAVIFGTLTVLLVGLLALELSGDGRVAIAAALVLALAPWHIQYSRMAWEAVTLGFSSVLALWLYFHARRRGRAWRFALAGAAFGLVFYSYTPAKLLVPALLAALVFIEWRDWKWTGFIADRVRKHAGSLPAPPVNLGLGDLLPLPRNTVGKRDAYALLGALLLVSAPLVVFQVLHFDEIQTRFRAVSVFREASPVSAIATSYVAHLHPVFLFLQGDANPRQGWAGWGELLLATAPFVLLGLIRAAARRDPQDVLLLAWTAIYPLGAALTSEGIPHASRSFLGAPLFALLAAQGAVLCLDKVLGRGAKGALVLMMVGALLANAAFALRFYFTQYPLSSGPKWSAGVEKLIPELASRKGPIKRVHFMPAPPALPDVAIVRDHVLFLTGFDPALDPRAKDPYWVWDQERPAMSWARFLAKLPRDEVLVTWVQPHGGWGTAPFLRVTDASGQPAFEVFQGFGK